MLPDAVINQIAAGEVVERPASVLKELLENALDAGATQISVTVADGGRGLIAVLDNGCGMDEADALLALQRHATSKLREAADLTRIATLGFRGEALASIAAVSRFELVTCADERAGGTRLALLGGVLREHGKVGFPRGSKVSVEELFCNTPARRKFLRAAATEFQHVQAVFVSLALAHPHVGLRLAHNGRPVHDLPRCAQLGERVYQLFGSELHEGLLPVAGAEGALRFEGLVSHPSFSKASRRWQYLFINARPIRHVGINHAVYQAYRTLLMSGRHPAYVLHLHLAPEELDVNVHPAKSEVRLRNPQLVHTVLAQRLGRALLEGPRRHVFGGTAGQPGAAQPGAEDSGARFTGAAYDASTAGGQQGLPGVSAAGAPRPGAAGPGAAVRAAFPQRPAAAVRDGTAVQVGAGPAAPFADTAFHFQALAAPLARPQGGAATDAPAGTSSGGLAAPEAQLPEQRSPEQRSPDGVLVQGGLALLGQFHNTYMLVQRGSSLLLVDQHAAHERILFERYRAQFYDGAPQGERYLIPLTLELSAQNALLLEQYLPQWRRMGFDLEPFGRHSFLVRQVPALLGGRDVGALILEVLDELALFGKSGRLEEVVNEILERVACHAAIRAGDVLSREEMAALLAQLEQLEVNLYCPHGRPVWVELSLHELERRFKRSV